LIKYVLNWHQYFLNKLARKKRTYHFRLRKNNILLEIPAETMRVFKEFFMKDAYDVHFLFRHLKKEAVIVDIGANIGLFTIMLLIHRPDLNIFSYEPLPENFNILQKNITSNSYTTQKVAIKEAAVLGKKQEELKLYFDRQKENTDSSSVIRGFENNYDHITVACTTLREIINEKRIEKISLLKLDCEGSEYSILYETPLEIISKIPFMVIETHDLDKDEKNIHGVKRFLDSLDYEYKTMTIDEKLNIIWAWKREKPEALLIK